jgi:hypothetical protein
MIKTNDQMIFGGRVTMLDKKERKMLSQGELIPCDSSGHCPDGCYGKQNCTAHTGSAYDSSQCYFSHEAYTKMTEYLGHEWNG